MASARPEFVVDFLTLFVAADWVEAHCIVPDGFEKGKPFELVDWQAWALLNFYRLRPGAEVGQLAPAFHYRRSQIVLPQKAGKAPYTAAHICVEAVGPALFAGWAKGGETWDCRDHGCECGWVYEYQPGEAMGMAWPTPLIQITATSDAQTDNIYDALRPMVDDGPLSVMIPKTGEEFIRLPDKGRIDVVTSSATSRLGARVTYVPQDEALALDTPLPTPTGWTTMGEVDVGDCLISGDGRPTRVVKATAVQHDRACFRVTFGDKTSVIASDGHRWMTRIAASNGLPRVRTTGEMAADGRTFRIPAASPYELPPADHPVDPYFLGLWLGDGATSKPEITAHEDDVAELVGHLLNVGVSAVVRRYGTGRAPTICFSSKSGFQGATRPAAARALQALPCYRDKHIPDAYFRGSLAQRVALLQGLMDSDGHVTETGFCTFAGNDRLTADVQRLLRTMGLQVGRVSREDHRARSGRGWKVNFTPRAGLAPPFRLARKVARVRAAWCGSDWTTVTIEPVPSVPVRCVAVEADDHLFLAGEGGHVTHNTGIWTAAARMVKVAETQRRGLAGMGGRAEETTNAWNPAEDSVAQRTAEAKARDIFRYHPEAPRGLSYRNKAERRKIHRHVYRGCRWVDLDAIEGEAAELIETDPAQAERFFGNRALAGEDAAVNIDRFKELSEPREVQRQSLIVIGVDGARFVDGFALVATDVESGYQWSLGIWERPESAGHDYEHPFDEVDGAMLEAFADFDVWRVYVDPQHIEHLMQTWQGRWGEKRVLPWWTNRPRQMAWAVRNWTEAVGAGDATNDGDPDFVRHVANARKQRLTVFDDKRRQMHTFSKDRPDSPRKMDGAMAAVLSWEARGDAIAADAGGGDSRDAIFI